MKTKLKGFTIGSIVEWGILYPRDGLFDKQRPTRFLLVDLYVKCDDFRPLALTCICLSVELPYCHLVEPAKTYLRIEG